MKRTSVRVRARGRFIQQRRRRRVSKMRQCVDGCTRSIATVRQRRPMCLFSVKSMS